jgi:hypothetical protein
VQCLGMSACVNFDSECLVFKTYSEGWMFPVKCKVELVHVQDEIQCHESILGSRDVALHIYKIRARWR